MLVTSFLMIAVAGATAPIKPADPTDTVVCKRDMLTGTRFAKKICMSHRAWDAMAERDGRALAEMRSRSNERESGRN